MRSETLSERGVNGASMMRALVHSRRKNRALVVPSKAQPTRNRLMSNWRLLRPFRQRHGLPFNTQDSIVSLVAVLLFISGPTAILWAVITVVVCPFERQLLWTFPYIFQEVLERSAPSFANRDSPPSVIVKVPRVRVMAALDHLLPNAVRGCSMLAVGCDPLFRRHSVPTTAGLSHSLLKRASQNTFYVPAVAFAFPAHGCVPGGSDVSSITFNYHQPSKSSASVVLQSLRPIDRSTARCNRRISFVHRLSMDGVSGATVSSGGFRALTYRGKSEWQSGRK